MIVTIEPCPPFVGEHTSPDTITFAGATDYYGMSVLGQQELRGPCLRSLRPLAMVPHAA